MVELPPSGRVLARRRRSSSTPAVQTQTQRPSRAFRIRRSIYRYLRLSAGLSCSALGISVIVSALAVAYAERPHSLSAAAGPESRVAPAPSFPAAMPAEGVYIDEVAFPLRSVEAAPAQELAETAESLEAIEEAPGAEPETPAAPPPQPLRVSPARGRIYNVNITFYDCLGDGFCGVMYNGQRVYEGAAACSWNLPIGTRFRIVGDPTGRIYRCADRGLLSNTWVDVFFHDPSDGWRWQSQVGRYGTIEIIEVPPY